MGLLLATIAVLAVTSPATADNPGAAPLSESEDPKDSIPEISAAQVQFDNERAVERGISVEEVRAEDAKVTELGEIAAKLEGDYDDLYIQNEWRRDIEPHAQLVLHGDIPPDAQALIGSASFDIEIVVPDGPSRWEGMETTMSILQAISDAGGIDPGGSFDPLRGTYEVSYSGNELSPSDQTAVTALGLGRQVELFYLGRAPSAGAAYVGGNGILATSSSATGWSCTAGFTVRSGSTLGIATAKHCPTPTNFSYSGNAFWYAGSLDPMYGDIEWGWALTGTALPQIRATTSQVLITSGIVGPGIGMGHCKYGLTSYTSCSTVSGLNHCQTYDNVNMSFCNLVEDAVRHERPGDSGGPHFIPNGSYASILGFTSGWYTGFWFREHTLWSAASALHNFAGVTAYS
jgi:streptogrisin B